MPKMLSWAKKISGRSSPKKSAHEPEVEKDSSPEKRKVADGKNMTENTSSLNSNIAEKSSTEKEHSSKDGKEVNSAISRETPNKDSSSDGQPSPTKQHSPNKTPSPEKTQVSVKKTPSFAKRFGSFRIPGFDRKSSEKSSRSKSRSPELEATSKDTSPSKIANNDPSNTEPSETVLIRNQHISVQKVAETNSTENYSKHEKSKSCQEPVQNKHSETDRLSNTDGSHIPETHPHPAENSNIGPSKLGRQSISEKLYGEVIREFDKMRTTRSRVLSNEFGSVSEENESLRLQAQKESSSTNSKAKDSIPIETETSERIDNINNKCLSNDKVSSGSRGGLEKEQHCGSEKVMEGEKEQGIQVTSPSNYAQISYPKPVLSPLKLSATTSSLSIVKEKQSLPDKSSSVVTKDDSLQHASNDITKNVNELTPNTIPLTKVSSSIVIELSSSPISNSPSVPVQPSPSSGDKLALRSNESGVLESEIAKKKTTIENTVETLSPSASASNEIEKLLPCLPKSGPPTCVKDKGDNLQETQVLEIAREEVAEDSSLPVITQNGVVSELSPPEVKNTENNNNPVPSVRLSKLPKLSSETTQFSVDTSTILSSKPSQENNLPGLSEDNNSQFSNDKDDVRDPSLNESCIIKESLPVHTSVTNGQVLSLPESSPKTDSANTSLLTEITDDPVRPEGSETSSKTEISGEAKEKLEQDSPLSSDEPPLNITKTSTNSQVHTDPEVSVVSCYNLDESIGSSKSTPARTDTCDSTDASLSLSSVKDDSSEISSKSNIVSPAAPQRSLHENINRPSEEASSPHTCTLSSKENGINKEISKICTDSGEYPSSGEGEYFPDSPSVPRRRKKSNPVPVVRSLQTLSPTSSGTLTPRETENNRERSSSQSKAPPRPPMPSSMYNPPHISSSTRLSATVSPKTSSTENFSISSQETHKHSQDTKNEPYNPFDSDEDTESTDVKQSILTSPQNSAGKVSLNPFDSDDDEEKNENNNNQVLNKRPQLPPASYNPFDEDDDLDVNGKDISSMTLDSTLKSLDDSIASLKSQSSVGTHESTSKNPFDDDEDEEGDLSYNGIPLFRQSIGRQSLAVRSSSPFQREGVRASLPSGGRSRTPKKKRQAPLPPGYRPSPCTTPLPPRSTMMIHGESSTSLYDGGSLRKNSMTSGSSLSLTSPKRTPPPRPPPPKGKSVSMAQL